MIRSHRLLLIIKALLLMFIFILSACSPEPVLRLESTRDGTMIYQGMEYLQSDLNESIAILDSTGTSETPLSLNVSSCR